MVNRLPDRLFAIVARIYRAQDRLRRDEAREAAERRDREQRAHYERLRAQHAAGEYGVTITTVSHVARRITWAHLS